MTKHRDITVRGITYADTRAVAAALGITQQTVWRAIKDGRLDTLGLGQRGRRLQPVIIRGKRYASAEAAAQALGVTTGAIRQAKSKNRLDKVGLKPEPNRHNAVPFVIAGLTFPSRRNASLALGFRGEFISHCLDRGHRRGRKRIFMAALRLKQERLKNIAPSGKAGSCAP